MVVHQVHHHQGYHSEGHRQVLLRHLRHSSPTYSNLFFSLKYRLYSCSIKVSKPVRPVILMVPPVTVMFPFESIDLCPLTNSTAGFYLIHGKRKFHFVGVTFCWLHTIIHRIYSKYSNLLIVIDSSSPSVEFLTV